MQLYPYQEEPTALLQANLEANGGRSYGVQLLGIMGSGKTVMVLEALWRTYLSSPTTLHPWFTSASLLNRPILITCPKQVKVDWQRTLVRNYRDTNFTSRIAIIAHEELRSSSGELYLNWRSVVVQGEIDYVPEWSDLFGNFPLAIFVDENQKVKNPASVTTKCIEAAIQQGIPTYLLSGTPYILMSETYIPCLATGVVSTKDDWNRLVAQFCRYEDPTKSHPTILENFNKFLEERGKLIRVRKVVFKHRINTLYTRLALNERKRPIYLRAYNEYLEKVRLVKTGKYGYGGNAWIEYIVAQRQFHRAAEALRADELAIKAYEQAYGFNPITRQVIHSREKDTKQVLVFANFVGCLRIVYKFLKKLNVPDKDISFTWGLQNAKETQVDKDRFQNGESKIHLVSLKKGGVGLNLNHFSTAKPGMKPRYILMAVSFSCVDFAQAMYRGHRANSITPSTIEVLMYANTVEERVVEVLANKNYSLAKLIGKRASFADLFDGGEFSGGDSKEDPNECLEIPPSNESVENKEEREELLATTTALVANAEEVFGEMISPVSVSECKLLN